MLRLDAHEVAARHHADQLAVLGDGKVMDLVLHHRQCRFVGEVPGIDRNGIAGHDVAYGGVTRQASRDDPLPEIAVRRYAGKAPAIHHEDCRHPFVDHLARGFLDGRGRVYRYRRSRDELRHGAPFGPVQFRRRWPRQQAVRQQPDEVGVESIVLAAKLRKDVTIEVIDQRVLDRNRLVAQWRCIHQRREAEHVPLGRAHDEIALGVAKFERAAANDVQLLVQSAERKNLAAGFVVADL